MTSEKLSSSYQAPTGILAHPAQVRSHSIRGTRASAHAAAGSVPAAIPAGGSAGGQLSVNVAAQAGDRGLRGCSV